MNQINVSYPETLAFSLKMQSSEFEREIKTASLVKFYELGKIPPAFLQKSWAFPALIFWIALPLMEFQPMRILMNWKRI